MNNQQAYELFKPVVDTLLNNWTALQLAVEHGMGGKQVAQEMADYVTRYCTENSVIDVTDVMEVLEDLLDEEFETICEDNSPREIAMRLVKYRKMFNEGEIELVKTEMSQLPKCNLWLCKSQFGDAAPENDSESTDESSESEDEQKQNGNCHTHNESNAPSQNGCTTNATEEPMEEDADPGWTVVKTKKKK